MSTVTRRRPSTLDPATHGLPTTPIGGVDEPDGGYCRRVRDRETGDLLDLTLHTGACARPGADETTEVNFDLGCIEAGSLGPTLLVSGYHAGWTYTDDGRYVSPTGFTLHTRGAGFDCCDCGVNTLDINEHYFLRHDLWNVVMAVAPAAQPNPHGTEMLCIGCVETRLGRSLTPDDFAPELPINDFDEPRSTRLKNRMGLA